MITRVVKLSFDPDKIKEFEALFNFNRSAIKSYKGCRDVKLMKNVAQKNCYFTVSSWESEELLNEYRNSPLFEKIWGEAKKYFNAKPEAWTLEEISNV